jgi:hypothetical protein
VPRFLLFRFKKCLFIPHLPIRSTCSAPLIRLHSITPMTGPYGKQSKLWSL